MKAKHTPGNWTYELNEDYSCTVFSDINHRTALVETVDNFPVEEEAEANAKLIAAAPELLLLITAFSNVNVFSPKDVAELTVEADKLIQKASP